MKRNETIKDKKVFNTIIRKGHFVKDENFVIYYKENNLYTKSKYGIAIKTSIGKANIRNKLKRQTRQIIDLNKKKFKNSYNYIIMIRGKSLDNGYNKMFKSMEKLLERIK